MATIKDRLKMFEANGPPIKPKPKIIPVKKVSNTDSGIITAAENDESIRKPQNDLVNVAMIPNTKNEVTSHVHDQNHDQLHQKKSDFNNTTNIIHDKNEDKIDYTVKDHNKNNKEDVIDNQDSRESDKSNDIIINKNESVICTNSNTDITIPEIPVNDLPENNYDDVDDDDLSYEYYGSIYYLPGLENFHFIEDEYQETTLVQPIHHNSNNSQQTIDDLQTNSNSEMSGKTNEVDLNIEEVAINLKRNASKKLIEEIFNTSIWRNSINYSDNFIFTPCASSSHNGTELDSSEKNSSNDFSSIISSSPSNDDRRKSLQSLSSKPIKKNIFSNVFRSKRGPKKSNEKTSQPDQKNDKYDSDGHRESTSKRSTASKTMEGDTDSAELATKKPLNSIFNRDWLNSLGEGIKKKANVMSELRKVFSHSKGKHLKQKPLKHLAGVSSEGVRFDALNDDLYDDGGEESMSSSEEDPEHVTIVSKQVEKGNINKVTPFCINNDDVIYDEDDDDDNDDDGDDDCDHENEINVNNTLQTTLKSSSKESIYEDGGDDEVSDSQNNQITKHSSHESVYDDGGEEDLLETTNNKEPDVPIVEIRCGNVANLKSSLNLKMNIPMKTPTMVQITKPPPIVDDSIYDDEDEEDDEEDDEENKNVYSKEKIKENLKLMHLKQKTNDKEQKKSDVNPGNTQLFKKTSGIKDASIKIETDKSEESNKKGDKTKENINESKAKNKKSNNNNMSDFKSLLQKITKSKSNNQKIKKVEKVRVNNKNMKNKLKLRSNNEKSDEYDMDDDNIEEYEDDVKNDDEEITIESGIQNLQKNKATNGKIDEETYDMDNYDIEEYVSDEIDDTISETVCQDKITKSNVSNKKLKGKLCKTDKINDDIYDDDDDEVKLKSQQKELSSKKLEINKKNKKTKKVFAEEYQEDAIVTNNKDKVVKENKKDKSKIKLNIPVKSDKKIDSKNCDDIYDEEYEEEEFNEVYVSDVEINDKKDNNATKRKDSKQNDGASKQIVFKSNKEKKKKQDDNIKTKISNNQNKSKKPNKKDKSAMETYIYDEDEPMTNESPKKKCSNDDEFFDHEDPTVLKLIKKNLNSAKKTFKLKDDIIPQSLAKVLKTVISQNKNHLQLNIGELVQILFHKDNLALVRNGLGKCGWTSPGNLQIIKFYESVE